MANRNTSALTALTDTTIASDDLLPVFDTSATDTKSITKANLDKSIGTVVDRLEEAVGGADAANTLYERYKRGENLGDMDAWGKAMELIVSATQLYMLKYGLSLPESKKIKDLIENMQTQVKISKGTGRGRPSSRGRKTERQ